MSEQKQEPWFPSVTMVLMTVLIAWEMVRQQPAGSKDFLTIQTIAVISSALCLIWLALETRFRRNIYVVTLITALSAVTASAYSFLFMSNPSNHLAQQILAIFISGLLCWALFFHIIAANFGYTVRLLFKRNSFLAQNWVKAIDYIYLFISSFSILRIVVSTVTTAQGSTYFNAFAAVLLGFAVALRVTRTSIEIFEWDKPPENRNGPAH
ncbi:MAG: hypothetical protein WBW81_00550 [Methylocella sp.]